MPYYPRRTYRRRRNTRRPRRMMRRPRRTLSKRAMNIHHFKRTITFDPIISQTTNSYGAYAFQFNQLPNFAEFTQLYDSYRINKIVIKYVPNINSANAGSTPMSQFHSVLDFNDATPLTSLSSAFEYQNWKMTRGAKAHTRTYTPSILDAVGNSGGVTPSFVKPAYKQWIATSSSDIPHFGLKWVAEATTNVSDIDYRPYVSVYFSCKSVK